MDSVVADEDDSVNVPPPPLEYLGNTHHVPSPNGPPIIPKYQNLDYKQTLIPILLTAGLCMLAIGGSRFVLAEDTVLGNLPLFLVIPLFAFGALAILFGVLTMFQVKGTLDAQQARATEAAAAT